MKKYLVLAVLTSCARPVIDIYEGSKGADGSNGTNGTSCTVSNSTISCSDGTSIEIHNGEDGQDGVPGASGQDGINGVDGLSMTYSLTEASEEQCSNGGSIFLLSIDINDNLTVDNEDANIQSAILCNGLDGSNGLNGNDGQNGLDAPPTPFTPVGLIDPCGDAPGIFDEVFLQMYDGTLLASFSDNANGKNTRFSILVPGNYTTTDNDNCSFTINNNGDIVNESHHY